MTDLLAHLHPPFDGEYLMRSHKRLLRALSDQIHPTIEKRIAVIGGCTTTGVVDMLRIFLLASGIRATFYESAYNRYYEDGVYGMRNSMPSTLRSSLSIPMRVILYTALRRGTLMKFGVSVSPMSLRVGKNCGNVYRNAIEQF